MRVPNLDDLVTAVEDELRQREQCLKLLPEWRHVLNWLNTLDDMPIFVHWVGPAFKRAVRARHADEGDPQRYSRMWTMLDDAYPKEDRADFAGDPAFSWSRLKGVVQGFMRAAEEK